MRSRRPEYLALLSAVVAVGISCGMLAILYFFNADHNHWLAVASAVLILFLAVYFTNKYILEQFIYDRIKLIYKTIHSMKLSKEDKQLRLRQIKGDAISLASEEVVQWAQSRTEEIEQLRKLEVFRKEFLGNVSHELKTPIFNIQGYVLTLLDGAYRDPQLSADFLAKTEKNIVRMISIVEELEIISRYETGEIQLEKTSFDIQVLCREVCELLEPAAGEKDIQFVFTSGNQQAVQVFADKQRIRQVLTNLLTNSIKYGKQGGRTKISFYDMDENVLIEVSDNGIGIEEHHLPRLFERFYRVEKSRNRAQGGTGLGLAIVKHIIEAHAQTINVRSTPDVGSTFSFTLTKAV